MPHWPWPAHPHPGTVEEVLAAVSHLHDHALNAVDASTSRLLIEFDQLRKDLAAMSASAQDRADALTAQITAMDAALQTGINAIHAEIAALKAQGTPVNLDPLSAAVATLATDVTAAAAIPSEP